MTDQVGGNQGRLDFDQIRQTSATASPLAPPPTETATRLPYRRRDDTFNIATNATGDWTIRIVGAR